MFIHVHPLIPFIHSFIHSVCTLFILIEAYNLTQKIAHKHFAENIWSTFSYWFTKKYCSNDDE